MKRRKLTIIAISLLSALTVSATTVATYAWFMYGNEITFGGNSDDVPIKAGANSSYYGGGDGSETNPFIISKPIHLYNLAWLQYIGTYNTPTIQQKYFKVTNDINMNEITLPPIGTEQYPFLSNFDGNNKTISNLTITNADPKTSDAYGVMKPDNTVLADTTQTKIVGFFGVVGKLPNQDITYNSSTLELKNITLDNISVASKTSETLIGLAAGYVDGTMSGVKIDGTATLDVNGQISTSISSITSNLSDYGLVGFSKQTGTGGSYSQKLSEFYSSEESSGSGDDDEWGGSFNSKDYTNWLYSQGINHEYTNSQSGAGGYSSTGTNVKVVSGAGGYNVTFTTSYAANPNNNHVVNRLRDGSFLPLKFVDDEKSAASLSNTGYLVGSDLVGVNASPKISSYHIRNIVNSIYDTTYYNRMDYVNSNRGNNGSGTMPTITYNDNRLEILTYTPSKINNKNWIRIKDSYNSSHNGVNPGLSSYTKSDATTPESLAFEKYNDSRNSLSNILTGADYIHGIHFDNNVVSASNVLTIPSGTARINGVQWASTYQVPKGSINFALKKTGFINFFAATYNSNNVNLNFFSLNQVFRNGGNITNVKRITQIYMNNDWDSTKLSDSVTNPKFVYKYSDNSYSSGSAGALKFDVQNSLESLMPVNNAVYYFELPVNNGEYAMGVAEGNQGAYLLYLDIGANGDTIASDKVEAYWVNTIKAGNPFPIGVDFAPVSVSGNGGETIGVIIASSKKGVITFVIDTADIEITDTSSIAVYSFQGSKYKTNDPPDGYFIVSGDSPGAPPTLSGGGERVLNIALTTTEGNAYSIKITDQLDEDGNIVSSVYELDGSSAGITKETINALSSELDVDSLRALNLAATLTRASGTGEFETTYDVENCSYADKVIDVDVTLNGTTISISVEDGYTLKIGGVSKTSGSVHP